jgi:hypothetical protein
MIILEQMTHWITYSCGKGLTNYLVEVCVPLLPIGSNNSFIYAFDNSMALNDLHMR